MLQTELNKEVNNSSTSKCQDKLQILYKNSNTISKCQALLHHIIAIEIHKYEKNVNRNGKAQNVNKIWHPVLKKNSNKIRNTPTVSIKRRLSLMEFKYYAALKLFLS